MPSGHKSWSSTIHPGGRKTHVKLGDYGNPPLMSLSAAKAERDRMRVEAREGHDPARERKQAKAEAANRFTFADLAADYMKRHAKAKKRSWKNDQGMLERDVLPALGAMEADKVTKRHIIMLLDRKADEGYGYAANRLRSLVHAIFAFGSGGIY